jgi:hypothetical protein
MEGWIHLGVCCFFFYLGFLFRGSLERAPVVEEPLVDIDEAWYVAGIRCDSEHEAEREKMHLREQIGVEFDVYHELVRVTR